MFPLAATSQKAPAKPASLVDNMERKIQYVQQNGALPTPDARPTEFTEQEANAYVASGRVKLPAGVQSVRFEAQQFEASWPSQLEVKSGTKVKVGGLGEPATLTLQQLSPVPAGLEGMAQSLIRADCQAQLDVLIDTFSARSGG